MSIHDIGGMAIDSEAIEWAEEAIQYQVPRKNNDALLKSYFEKHINELLLFIYPDIGDILDVNQAFVSCDKELHEMNMDRESSETTWRVDLLFKGKLKDGKEQYFLINIEIEGGNDKYFGERFYNYYIHILAKFKKPVVSLVVYTGDENQPRPTEHKTSLLETSMHFKFKSYWVYDHSAEELLAMDNIFAMVVAAVQASQLEKKVSENVLGDHRIAIAKALLSNDKLERKEAGAFMKFLKSIIFIKDPEINLKFPLKLTLLG